MKIPRGVSPKLDQFKDRKNLKRKLVVGTTIVVVGGAYIWHRRKLDETITQLEFLSQSAVQDTMWTSFDEGVKYGLALAKQTAETAGDYAFSAFDKADRAAIMHTTPA